MEPSVFGVNSGGESLEEGRGKEDDKDEETNNRESSGDDATNNGDGDGDSSTGMVAYDESLGTPPKKLRRAEPRVDSLDVESMQVMGLPFSPIPQDPSLGLVLQLAFQTIGVVYSGLGTSPLYVYGNAFNNVEINSTSDILGALSIVIYTLTLIPLIKYDFVVLRAYRTRESDFKGGSFSLYSMICHYARASMIPNRQPTDEEELSHLTIETPTKRLERAMTLKGRLEKSKFWKTFLLVVALLGVSFVICDGILTPCISVMSAINGLSVAFPSVSQDRIIEITIALLLILFCLQGLGTGKVKFFFAPLLCLWFVAIAAIGIYNIVKYDPTIFRAFNPAYIYYFFATNKWKACSVLGGLVLCISGGETMFADLGNFPLRSIQIAFGAVVYPCLLLAYMGQAAYLVKFPLAVHDVFYQSVPGALFWPMFILSILAAMIASRSMILATFSVINMALALDCFPRVTVIHTSRRFMGQMYIPTINWFMAIMCVFIIAGFKSTDFIAHAFGLAVLGDMLITTAFATLIMVLIWKTPLILSLTFLIVVGGVELIYLLAILLKVRDAGWVTLALATALVSVMYIWHYGTRMKYQSELDQRISMDYMLKLGPELGTKRVEGVGLLYNELIQGVPAIFGYFLKKLPATHSTIVFVCIKYINVPAVPQTQRFIFRRVCPRDYHIFRCVARYGYKDVRKESHEIFEELLLKSLETFIHREAQEYVLEFGDVQRPSDDNDNGVAPPVGRNEPVSDELTQPLLQRIADENIDDIDVVETPESLDFRESVVDSIALKELLLLEEAKKKGRVVYLIGHADVRAKKESWFFRKLVINYFYSFLSRNCRATSDLLNVPPTKRLQVGMTYMV